MPECAKTHLQQSRISKFSGGRPRTPPLQGEVGEGRGGEGGEREGKEGGEGGRGRIGKGGERREGTGEGGEEWGWWGGEGRSSWALPPRDKLWIRPWHSPFEAPTVPRKLLRMSYIDNIGFKQLARRTRKDRQTKPLFRGRGYLTFTMHATVANVLHAIVAVSQRRLTAGRPQRFRGNDVLAISPSRIWRWVPVSKLNIIFVSSLT